MKDHNKEIVDVLLTDIADRLDNGCVLRDIELGNNIEMYYQRDKRGGFSVLGNEITVDFDTPEATVYCEIEYHSPEATPKEDIQNALEHWE